VGDGSGLAKVVLPGKEPAVAIALESKGVGLEPLKCMVSVGLNSLNISAAATLAGEAQQEKALARLDSASGKVEMVEAEVERATKLAKQAKATYGAATAAGARSRQGGCDVDGCEARTLA